MLGKCEQDALNLPKSCLNTEVYINIMTSKPGNKTQVELTIGRGK